jgi:hypothetical protein
MNIEFKTDNVLAMDYPPVPAKKMIPEWYKRMSDYCIPTEHLHDAKYYFDNDIESAKTIRGCMPVLDYLTSGYIIRSHSQILITPEKLDEENKTFWWKSSDTHINNHATSQCPIKIDDMYHVYMKYDNCWRIKVPKGYSCLFYQPKFYLEDRYVLFPAIVDCDEFDGIVAFPGYVKARSSFYINPGDPIMAVFPFKREDWTSEIVKLSEEEGKRPSKIRHYLHTRYKQLFHKKKSYK